MPLGFGSNDKKRSSSAFIASVSQQLFSEIQNVTSSSHRSRQASSNHATVHPKSSTTTSYLDLFKELWKETIAIFSKNLINDDDVDRVKENLNQMMSLLLNELNKAILSHEAGGQDNSNKLQRNSSRSNSSRQFLYGPVWEFFFKHNIFEVIFLWSLSYPEYLYDLKYEQLCHYENLIGHLQATEQTDLLFSSQIHQPLFSLLNHCASHNSPLIENHMIAILNQLCVCICKNDKLLSIFFDPSTSSPSPSSSSTTTNNNNNNNSDFVYANNKNSFNSFLETSTSSPQSSTFYSYDRQQGPAKFLIFSLLIPYIHKEGSLGQQARDALLLIMQLSARNASLAKYIVDHTDFCPILATGLSGLYSDLPPKLTVRENFEEIRYLQEADIVNIHSLNKFINSLEFCNNVIQISHSLISNQLLQYVYHGFLVPVLAPALTQDTDLYPSDLAKLEEYTNCIDEIVTATVYLDLFLRRVNEVNLQRLFLKFILYFKLNEKTTLLDTFISRINSNSKLTLTTLMLFYTMIDLNSEDVIYKLILVHLMPCKHLMKSQIATLKETSYEINGLNAQAFLSLSTNYMNFDGGNSNNTSNNRSLVSLSSSSEPPTPIADWINTVFDNREVLTLLSYIDSMRFNFIDYLKDAKSGIKATTKRTARWSHKYDAVVNLKSVGGGGEDVTTTNEKEAIFRKRPVLVNRPALDLDFEPEEFLLNLNLSATAIEIEPVATELPSQSRRSTMNLSTGGDDQAESDNNKDGQVAVVEETGDKKNRGAVASSRKKKESAKTTKASSKPTKSSKKSTSGNDFYVLSFDNELSESSSSDDEDDGEESSPSSSVTSSNPSLDETTPERKEQLDQANRSKLVDYLFMDNSNSTFDGSLNNFLSALDNYFVQNAVATGLEVQKTSRRKSSSSSSSFNEINKICDEIVNIYNECFMVRSVPKPLRLSSAVTNTIDEDDDKENVPREEPSQNRQKKTTSNYSINGPADSLKNGQTNSGSNDDDDTNNCHVAQETDIGPFLCAIFNRLENFLCNSLQINFLITGLLARLAYYPQLLLRSFLLNQNIVMQPNIKSLMQVLTCIKAKIDSCSQTYDNFNLLYLKAKLNLVKRLLDLRSKTTTATTLAIGARDQRSSSAQTPLNQSFQSGVVTSPTSTNNVQINLNQPKKTNKFTVDRILNIFFKPPPPSSVQNESGQQFTASSNVQYKNTSPNSSQATTTQLDPNSSSQSPQSTSSTNDDSLDTASRGGANQSLTSCPKSPVFDQLFTPGLELDFREIKNRFNGTRSKTAADQLTVSLEKSYDDFVQLEVDWEDHNTRNIAYSTVIYDEFIKELAAICQEHCVLTQE